MEKEQIISVVRTAFSAAALTAVWWLAPADGALRFLLFLIPYLAAGYEVIFTALKNILKGDIFDENTLMLVATVGALAIGEYPEAVAVMLFYGVGEFFEDMATEKSKRSIADLMRLKPDTARILREGRETAVSPEEVAVGELISVFPGERIPIDGVVVSGSGMVDTSALTGEAVPRDIREGENAVSGTVSLTGALTIRTTQSYGDSTVSRILDLAMNASEKKARAESFVTRFSRIYTPAVIACAVLIGVCIPLFTDATFAEGISKALIFLVVSCPCALVVSVPLSFFGGIGGAAKRGILIKGSVGLEKLANARVFAFDKTGTLTRGTFSVTGIHPSDISEAELLDIAALAESRSDHPIARSVVRAHGGHIDKSRIKSIRELAGLGIEAVIDGKTVYAGNDLLLENAGISFTPCNCAGTKIHVAADGRYCGHILISDEAKPDSADAIAGLKRIGIEKTVMLTGDAEETARRIGDALGIDETRAGLLPGGKVAAVEDLCTEGCTLAFVGDGINDAPVIARADVGIAMGALGSDAAIEAADVVIMDDKPSRLVSAVRSARRTMRIVRENIVFSLSVKAAVLILSAAGITGMWIAVFADVGVSVIAVLNATRALKG